MEREELSAWLRLTLTPGVGNGAARKLLAAFGLPTAVFTQPANALMQVVSTTQATSLRTEPPGLALQLETTWRWLHGEGMGDSTGEGTRERTGERTGQRRIVVLGDAGYPSSLLNIEDPPLMLYLLGAALMDVDTAETQTEHAYIASDLIAKCLGSSAAQSIAIVGSRNPTPQGLVNARQFARALGTAGLTIVSGMALGVDGAAHEGALEGFEDLSALKKGEEKSAPARLSTIAVVGTGLDRVYPKSHRALAHKIARHGLIISEYPLGTPPLALNFPRRNRIIAGLTQGTLVVEAALKSGSLITARMAAEQGKEVFAIPGSIHSTQSRGCHALIRQGAKLVESAQDVLEDMKIENTTVLIATHAQDTGAGGTNDSENVLLEALGFDPVSLDALQARTGIDTPNLQAQLMALELQGQVARLPGGLFQRTAEA